MVGLEGNNDFGERMKMQFRKIDLNYFRNLFKFQGSLRSEEILETEEPLVTSNVETNFMFSV